MLLLRLAVRNLWRNSRRTLIAMAAVTIGLTLCVTHGNFTKGAWSRILDANIRDSAGHVVVQAKGYQAEPDDQLAVPDSAAQVEAIRKALPEAQVLRRTFLSGLMTSTSGAIAVRLNGIEPGPTQAISELDDRLQSGEWLSDDKGVLIGVGLAKSLGVELGDKLVFMAKGADNEIDSVLYRVKGIYRTGGEAMDNYAAYATFPSTQRFLPVADGATQIAVDIPDWAQSDAATAQVRAALPDLEVLPWNEALPELQEQAEMKRVQGRQTLVILLALIAVGILNVQLMSVLERTRELGVLRALGMRPAALAAMVVLEGLLLGVFASAVGLLGGSLVTEWLIWKGVNYGDMLQNVQSGGILDPVVRPDWDFETMTFYTVASLTLAMAATLWPAWRVTRLTPLDAMRAV